MTLRAWVILMIIFIAGAYWLPDSGAFEQSADLFYGTLYHLIKWIG